tara:strand:+ start:170 stop:376 length:207 start_codon:yes stop_codon:yes gene_type:complete
MALQLLTLLMQNQRKARDAIYCSDVAGNNVWNKTYSSVSGECVSFAQKKRAQGSLHVWNMEYYYYSKA